jgi:hypothetical protein
MELAAIKLLLGGLLSKAWAFFSKPPGLYLAIAVALMLAVWWFGQHEFNRGKAECELAHQAAGQHEVVRQEKVGVKVKKDSDARTAPHVAQDQGNRETVRIIYEHAKAVPDADYSCVDPADADRLRSLN